MSLLGRDRERDVIDGVLARARAGESAALVLRGEPGIGKTAVLEYAAETAEDALVLRARGIESEVDIAFGGLHALLRPVVEVLDRLPAPQAAALRGALGLAVVDAGERHLVGAATLGLLGVLAEERPVVVLVDDFQWLDGPSAGALVFAARRLLADAVAVVVAARSGEPSAVDGAGLPELELAGLDPEPAHALLAAHAGRPVPRDTAAWLQEATGGNPLALVELAEEAPRLRPSPIGAEVPVGQRIARAFGRRLEGLSPGARATVLAVAVADAEELEPALAAAVASGGSIAALEEAEAARLVAVEAGRVRFHHPLVRSAVLAAASPSERRAAHRAYAEALADGDAEERRAWHAAAGTVAPSEPVAAALATAGARAAGRGGHASASAAFQQAARLTPGAALRAERLRGPPRRRGWPARRRGRCCCSTRPSPWPPIRVRALRRPICAVACSRATARSRRPCACCAAPRPWWRRTTPRARARSSPRRPTPPSTAVWRRASRRWRGAPPRSRRTGTCGRAAWLRRHSARRSCCSPARTRRSACARPAR